MAWVWWARNGGLGAHPGRMCRAWGPGLLPRLGILGEGRELGPESLGLGRMNRGPCGEEAAQGKGGF